MTTETPNQPPPSLGSATPTTTDSTSIPPPMSFSFSPIQNLPTDVLAYILSYATSDADRISELLDVILLHVVLPIDDTTSVDRPHPNQVDNISSNVNILISNNDNNDEESIFRSLCLLHWKSVASQTFDLQWRPNFQSWKTLFKVLQTWVPREGFYTILEAAPWGLLLRFRFIEGGIFVGDLLWPGEEEEMEKKPRAEQDDDGTVAEEGEEEGSGKSHFSFDAIRVLEVTFSEQAGGGGGGGGGEAEARIKFCGEEEPNAVLETLDSIPNNGVAGEGKMEAEQGEAQDDSNVLSPVVLNLPGYPDIRVTDPSRTLRLYKPSSPPPTTTTAVPSEGYPIDHSLFDHIWDPDATTTPTDLLRSLWYFDWSSWGRGQRGSWQGWGSSGTSNNNNSRNRLTLDWVDGPSRQSTFRYREGMPIIRPGLYSGVYADIYGKFKREVVLVEYRQYDFDGNNRDDDDDDDDDVSDEEKGRSGADDSLTPPTSKKTKDELTWDRIKTEIFNSPEQRDGYGFYDAVRTVVQQSHSCQSVVFVVGRKVTGDYHVPLRKSTFVALVHPAVVSILPPTDEDDEEGNDDEWTTDPPTRVQDRGGAQREYDVLRSWAGWGTLAYPGFISPGWSQGTLVQVSEQQQQQRRRVDHVGSDGGGDFLRNSASQYDNDDEMVGLDRFGFMWRAEAGTSILTRMPEQEEFPWFS